MPAEQKSGMQLTFLGAAHKVLAEAGEPLHAHVIAERALATGLLRTGGKTPWATMAAQLYTDIQRRGDGSDFVRVARGAFGLRA
jgi:restriction system protein